MTWFVTDPSLSSPLQEIFEEWIKRKIDSEDKKQQFLEQLHKVFEKEEGPKLGDGDYDSEVGVP